MTTTVIHQKRVKKEKGKQRLGVFRVFNLGDTTAQPRTRCPNHKHIKVRVGGKCPHCGWPEVKK